ncbi:MAG: A/G-specific adenine glycosylase [Myxococcaceae bacterium]|nr:A/G-specific adenine glycosylase [Myxococcaceae bacterium]
MAPAPSPRLRPALLQWFDRHQRDLPWRRTSDPYAIWLSEIMLQQTQVSTVVPYWERFFERFPNVRALAAAPLDDVLGLWRGLGYYSRARLLHRAAQAVVSEHGGHFPPTAEELRALPGFGRYTAGAVASIAFEEEAPLVDGNVARVFSRWFAIEGPPGDKAREELLWRYAEACVKGERPGDWNQAVMELGATVCVKHAPLCLLCPVSAHCQARKEGREHALPPARRRAAPKEMRLYCAVTQKNGAVLLGRRENKGLFGGLWELPSTPVLPELSALLGTTKKPGASLGTVERVLTHRKLTLELYPLPAPKKLPRPSAPYAELKWQNVEALATLGISAAMQAALKVALPAHGKARR